MVPARTQTELGALPTLLRPGGASVRVSASVALLSRAPTNSSSLSEHFTGHSSDRWLALGAAPGADLATGALLGEIGRHADDIDSANDRYLLEAYTLVMLPLVLALRAPRAAQGPAIVTADATH